LDSSGTALSSLLNRPGFLTAIMAARHLNVSESRGRPSFISALSISLSTKGAYARRKRKALLRPMLNLETNSTRVPNKQAPIEIKGSIQYPLITKAAPKAKPLIMTAPMPAIKSGKGLNENMKASAIKEAISGHKNKCMPWPGVTQIPVNSVFTSRAEDSEMEIPPLAITGGPIMQKLASDACAR